MTSFVSFKVCFAHKRCALWILSVRMVVLRVGAVALAAVATVVVAVVFVLLFSLFCVGCSERSRIRERW